LREPFAKFVESELGADILLITCGLPGTWKTETSEQATSDGGTGKTTVQMQNIDTFSGAAWNIIAVALNQTNPAYIWNIVDDVTYPFLSWQ